VGGESAVEVFVLGWAGEDVVAVLGGDFCDDDVVADFGDEDVEQGGGDQGALGVNLSGESGEGGGEGGGLHRRGRGEKLQEAVG
jgi:hypothetical protein